MLKTRSILGLWAIASAIVLLVALQPSRFVEALTDEGDDKCVCPSTESIGAGAFSDQGVVGGTPCTEVTIFSLGQSQDGDCGLECLDCDITPCMSNKYWFKFKNLGTCFGGCAQKVEVNLVKKGSMAVGSTLTFEIQHTMECREAFAGIASDSVRVACDHATPGAGGTIYTKQMTYTCNTCGC